MASQLRPAAAVWLESAGSLAAELLLWLAGMWAGALLSGRVEAGPSEVRDVGLAVRTAEPSERWSVVAVAVE